MSSLMLFRRFLSVSASNTTNKSTAAVNRIARRFSVPREQLPTATNAPGKSSSTTTMLDDGSSSDGSSASKLFTVCTYNVLCQSTLMSTQYLYRHCQREHLAWNYRWNLLETELSMLNADIFCLQEVEAMYYESHYLKYFQSRGYDGLYKQRVGGKLDGCATFWRRDRFDLKSSDSMHFQVPNSMLDRDNIALIVILVDKNRSSTTLGGPRMEPSPAKKSKTSNNGAGGNNDGRREQELEQRSSNGNNGNNKNTVVVANTHLLFNPGRGDIKLCQVAMLVARLQKICQSASSSNPYGLVICGDFNSVPHSPLYKLMTDGRLDYVGLRRAEISGQKKRGGPPLKYPLLPSGANIDEGTCRELTYDEDDDVVVIQDPGCLAHPIVLASAYSHRTTDGEPEVSTHHSSDSTNVDYIFYKVKSKTMMKQQQQRVVDEKRVNYESTGASTSYKVETEHRVETSSTIMPDIKDEKLRCRSVMSLPCTEQIQRSVGWLPNQYCASDHLPLMAEFEFL